MKTLLYVTLKSVIHRRTSSLRIILLFLLFRGEASNKIGNIISAIQKIQRSPKWKNMMTKNRRKKLKAAQDRIKTRNILLWFM